MTEPWILAVDLGTGGPKTGAVTLDGELLAVAHRRVPTTFTGDGGALQDPHAWWQGIREGVAEVLGHGVAPRAAIGVGITGQWGSTVPVGADDQPVGPCLLWSDTRGGSLAARRMGGPITIVGYSPGNLLAWLRLTGGAPSLHGADPLGHDLQLRSREPELYARVETLLEPIDYIGMRLTGRRAATQASMTLSWLTDNRSGSATRYHPALLRRSGREAAKLPELVPTGSILGDIRAEVAAELGIPAGLPVVAGVPDLHTGYLGSGAVAPFAGHATISTTSWIGCAVPFKRTDVFHQIAAVPGLRPGSYLIANNHETAGACLDWLRGAVGAGADAQPGSEPDAYARLTALAATAPVGSGGVLFTPWLNGERSPVEDRTLRAAFLNISMTTERAHIVRAVLEGVAFNARWLLDAVERFIKRPMPALRLLGGGAASDLWCQIHADILGRRIEQVEAPMYANLRGAAFFAGMSLGRLELADVGRRVRITRAFDPDPAARTVYESIYVEYRRLYHRLHGVYARLNA